MKSPREEFAEMMAALHEEELEKTFKRWDEENMARLEKENAEAADRRRMEEIFDVWGAWRRMTLPPAITVV
ncbi:hypothetical protein KDL45_13335 [bacterium]|nr:hypothetical protein [bacterium]